MSNPLFIKAPFLTRKNFFNTNKTNNVFCLIYPFYLSPHQTQVLELKIRDILSIGFFLPAKNCCHKDNNKLALFLYKDGDILKKRRKECFFPSSYDIYIQSD